MSGFALRGARCNICRQNALQSFVTIAGVSIAPTRQPRGRITLQQPRANRSLPHVPSRFFGSSSFQHKAAADKQCAENDVPQREESPAPAEHVPWYLQDAEAADDAPHPLQERQRLPPLPTCPPPILEDLLPHLSVDIGLDDLSLIDLRGADPPPALGMNLVMIIGTARSVKHLNVSGDRLCRWLRKTHKLRPTADGLMGSNELKVKLKRKARRAKLGKNVGRSMEGKDDGLTTGWVCVDVGPVEDGGPPKEKPTAETGFVGFGGTDDKAQVVVQMFTEDMRAEFDLDSLWNDRVAEHVGELNESDSHDSQIEVRHSPDDAFGRPSNRVSTSISNSRGLTPLEQRRGIHTTRPQLTNGAPEDQVGPSPSGDRSSSEMHQYQEAVDGTINITSLFRQLSDLPKDEARHELGQGPDDKGSTLFLQIFYRLLSENSPKAAVLYRFNLIAAAVILSHPDYTKTHLFDEFQDLASSGYDISEAEAFSAVRALLSFPEPNNSGGKASSVLPPLPEGEFDQALRVMDHVSLRGINILHERIFFWLLNAAGYQGPVRADDDPDPTVASSSTPVPAKTLESIHRTQDRLIKAMRLVDVWFDSSTFLKVLRTLYDHGNYDAFWTLWRKKVLCGVSRTKEDYVLLFQLHAERGHQRDTIKCLFDWVPMTSREVPPVYVDGDLAHVVRDCVAIADPLIERKAEESVPGTLVRYWNQCTEVLKEDGLL